MFNIGDFFKRVQNVRMKGVLVQNVVAEAVQKIVSYPMKPEDIIISSTVATLKGISSIVRSEVFIKKQLLLDEINSKQDIKKITDIK